MAINTLFHLTALSLKGEPPSQWRAAKRILFLPDLFAYWLSGRMGTEYTIASTSQMLDARTRAWSAEVLGAIGVDAERFRPIQMPGLRASVRGTVLPAANEALAAAGVPVIAVGSHDTASAVAAAFRIGPTTVARVSNHMPRQSRATGGNRRASDAAKRRPSFSDNVRQNARTCSSTSGSYRP